MALYTRQEISERTGIENKNIGVYISRGKLILDKKSGKIDDANPTNDLFLQKHQGKAKPSSKAAKVPAAGKKSATKAAAPQAKTALGKMEEQKKLLEIQKVQQELKLNELRLSKQQGHVVPIEIVKLLYAQHFKSVYKSFEVRFSNLLVKIGGRTSMSNADMAYFKAELIKDLNEAVKDGVAESKKGLQKMTKEYSETRGVGEKQKF